jgi:hypothetical protein
MAFRIALGRCDCRTSYRNAIDDRVCNTIQETLASWRSRLPDDIAAVPTESFEEQSIDGRHVTFGTFKLEKSPGRTLIVCQALIHTWWRPTFLSLGAVGRMYAEGLLVTNNGDVEPAPDDLMWKFR